MFLAQFSNDQNTSLSGPPPTGAARWCCPSSSSACRTRRTSRTRFWPRKKGNVREYLKLSFVSLFRPSRARCTSSRASPAASSTPGRTPPPSARPWSGRRFGKKIRDHVSNKLFLLKHYLWLPALWQGEHRGSAEGLLLQDGQDLLRLCARNHAHQEAKGMSVDL